MTSAQVLLWCAILWSAFLAAHLVLNGRWWGWLLPSLAPPPLFVAVPALLVVLGLVAGGGAGFAAAGLGVLALVAGARQSGLVPAALWAGRRAAGTGPAPSTCNVLSPTTSAASHRPYRRPPDVDAIIGYRLRSVRSSRGPMTSYGSDTTNAAAQPRCTPLSVNPPLSTQTASLIDFIALGLQSRAAAVQWGLELVDAGQSR